MVATSEIALGFNGIGASARLRVVLALVNAGQEGMLIGDLQRRLDIPASTLAHHLHVLVSAGLISQERCARTTVCRPNLDFLETLAAFLLQNCCSDGAAPPNVGDDRLKEVNESN